MLDVQARTTVQAHLMRPDLLVEVTATAAVRNDSHLPSYEPHHEHPLRTV